MSASSLVLSSLLSLPSTVHLPATVQSLQHSINTDELGTQEHSDANFHNHYHDYCYYHYCLLFIIDFYMGHPANVKLLTGREGVGGGLASYEAFPSIIFFLLKNDFFPLDGARLSKLCDYLVLHVQSNICEVICKKDVNGVEHLGPAEKKVLIAFCSTSLSWRKYLPNIFTIFFIKRIFGEVFTIYVQLVLNIFITSCLFLIELGKQYSAM